MQTGTVSRLWLCRREDSKIDLRGILCIFGSHTFVPILDVQEINCRFAQFNRIWNHLFGRLIEIRRTSCSRTVGSDCFCFGKHESDDRENGVTCYFWQRSKVSREDQRWITLIVFPQTSSGRRRTYHPRLQKVRGREVMDVKIPGVQLLRKRSDRGDLISAQTNWKLPTTITMGNLWKASLQQAARSGMTTALVFSRVENWYWDMRAIWHRFSRRSMASTINRIGIVSRIKIMFMTVTMGISSIHGKELPEQLSIHCEHDRSHTQTNVRHIYEIGVHARWDLKIGNN